MDWHAIRGVVNFLPSKYIFVVYEAELLCSLCHHLDLLHQLAREANVEGVREARQGLASDVNVILRHAYTYYVYTMKVCIFSLLSVHL